MVKRILALSLLMVVMSACGGQEDHGGVTHSLRGDNVFTDTITTEKRGVGQECSDDIDDICVAGSTCKMQNENDWENRHLKYYCVSTVL